jgi:4-amino-4-deoxy-L-arabinose transferase-like glycosyltransferase
MKLSSTGFISENKHLFLVSIFAFLISYISTFTKGYGYFIDEFYYIACANNPAAGYVDHPPLAPLILTLFQFVFGNSIYAIRVLPALAEAVAVFYIGILTKEIGGGKFAQLLAAAALAATPVIVAFGSLYTMNAFEPLFAILLLYFVIRMIKENNPKLWIISGIIMGLGMMNKHTFGLFIIALILSLLLAGKWRLVTNKWLVAGGLCGIIIFFPNIIWQIINNCPSLEFYRNIGADKNVYTPPLAFIIGQILAMSPSNILIWFPGFLFLLFSKKTKDFRFLSILFISLFLFMMLSGTSRSDRLAFAYPAAFLGGALFYENIILKYKAGWLKGVLIVSLIVGLLIAIPVIIPYFNYETVQAHTKFLGLNTEMEKGKKPPLPQLLADRIGWEEKFKLVLAAYQSLTDEEKKETIIAAGNYGQAGALELFGEEYNFPTVSVDIIVITCGVRRGYPKYLPRKALFFLC